MLINLLLGLATMMLCLMLQALLLVIGNLAQIAIWALLFVLTAEFQAFDEAFYHSAVNFATLGYGDVVMSAKHRLLGPLEAVNGVLMIGVSTAALMAAFQGISRRKLQSLKEVPRGK